MQRKSWKKVLTSFALKQKCEQVKLFKSWGKLLSPGKMHVFFVNETISLVNQKKESQNNYRTSSQAPSYASPKLSLGYGRG